MLLAGSSVQCVTRKELISQAKFGNFWLNNIYRISSIYLLDCISSFIYFIPFLFIVICIYTLFLFIFYLFIF